MSRRAEKLTDEQFEKIRDQFYPDGHTSAAPIGVWFDGELPNGRPAKLRFVQAGGKFFYVLQRGPLPVRVGREHSNALVAFDVYTVDSARQTLTHKNVTRRRRPDEELVTVYQDEVTVLR